MKSMIFIKLRRKVLILPRKTKSDEKASVCKGYPRVKVMTMLKETEKVKKISRMMAILCNRYAKEGSRISRLIRIQIEEIKRKVGVRSPAALRFIGPGDFSVNLIQRGVVTYR